MTEQNKPKIVVVGGVAGGASAATRARRMNEHAEIIVFEKDEYVSFANCGLPYYIGGEIEQREKLLVATPEFLYKRFRLDVRVQHEVTQIDRDKKTVSVVNHATGEQLVQPYDKLILSMGASPFVPPIPGVDAPNVKTLRNIPDTDQIYNAVTKQGVKKAVVVGAGFIGLEMVEQFVGLGIETTLIELQPQVLPLLDPEMAHPLERALQEKNVALHLGDGIENIVCDDCGKATAVQLKSGTIIETDLVLLGIGVRPNTQLAEAAKIELGPSRGIATNQFMQTNDPEIYAVGDVAEYTFGPTGQKMRIALAGPANRSGRLAGEHAATGKSQPMANVQGTSIVRLFDLTAATTGLSQSLAVRLNLNVASATIIANHHAGYYPGAEQMTLKLIYCPETYKVLGAQVIGGEGADKRIDVIASVICMKGTIYDLAGLDLAYAPPFGSAKDPVHMVAFAACNQIEGVTEFLPPEFKLEKQHQVIDVRTPQEISKQPLAVCNSVIEIPVDELRDRLGELDPKQSSIAICASGLRAHTASRILKQNGFAEVKVLTGGANVRNRCSTSQLES